MASLNQVTLIGNLGTDPETRKLNSGDKVVNFRIATSETWTDKSSGEKKERTEWHSIVVFGRGENGGLAGIAEKYLKKGSRVFVQGQMKTRTWEKDGIKHYATEVVLGFDGKLLLMDSKLSGGGRLAAEPGSYGAEPAQKRTLAEEMDDEEIPFMWQPMMLSRRLVE